MKRVVVFLLCSLASVSVAGPYRHRMDEALDALDRGRAQLRSSSAPCRESVSESFRVAMRDIEDVRRGAPDERLNRIQLHIAGMALAAALATCPEPLVAALSETQNSLQRARRILQDRDRDRDQEESPRWREEPLPRVQFDGRRDGRPRRPMSEESFTALVQSVRAESFSEEKLTVLDTAVRGGARLTVDQVGRLVDLFSFGSDKVKAVELLNPSIVDRQNAFKIYGRFSFSSEKERVQQILGT